MFPEQGAILLPKNPPNRETSLRLHMTLAVDVSINAKADLAFTEVCALGSHHTQRGHQGLVRSAPTLFTYQLLTLAKEGREGYSDIDVLSDWMRVGTASLLPFRKRDVLFTDRLRCALHPKCKVCRGLVHPYYPCLRFLLFRRSSMFCAGSVRYHLLFLTEVFFSYSKSLNHINQFSQSIYVLDR